MLCSLRFHHIHNRTHSVWAIQIRIVQTLTYTADDPRISIKRPPLALSVSGFETFSALFKIRYTTTATTAAQPSCHPRHLHASDSCTHNLRCQFLYINLDTYITSTLPVYPTLSLTPGLPTDRALSRRANSSSRNGAGQAIVRLGDETRS